MGNCQAIDAAALVIQHPCGKVDHMYWPVPVNEIMKIKPDHHVALLITTTTTTTTTTGRNSVRRTRVKLLRPTDTLALGHVYRLISNQEVMKGLRAKKQLKMRKNGIEVADSEALKEAEKLARKSHPDKTHQVSRHGHGHRSRTTPAPNRGKGRPKTWQPSLHSISEAAS